MRVVSRANMVWPDCRPAGADGGPRRVGHVLDPEPRAAVGDGGDRLEQEVAVGHAPAAAVVRVRGAPAATGVVGRFGGDDAPEEVEPVGARAHRPLAQRGDVRQQPAELEHQRAVAGAAGVAFRGVSSLPLYPTIGLHSKDERVVTNLGTQPFMYDVESYLAEDRRQRAASVSALDVPASVTHELVRDYLHHHGYAQTLAALDASSSCSPSQPAHNSGDKTCADEGDKSGECKAEDPELAQRSKIRKLISSGDIDGAERMLEENYPRVLRGGRTELRLHIACQHFIEMIRAGDTDRALDYARWELTAFRGLDPRWDCVLRDVVALIAYEKPGQCPLSPLLTHAHQDRVADAVNAAILAVLHQKESTSAIANDVEDEVGKDGDGRLRLGSKVEVLLREHTAVSHELRIANGSRGEVFHLSKELRNPSST